MIHECRYDFPLEKCLEMGCECFYSQVQAHFEFVSEQLLDPEQLDKDERTYLAAELERCLNILNDFHLLFPESGSTDCSATSDPALDTSTYIVFCSSCKAPMGVRRLDRFAPEGIEEGVCGKCGKTGSVENAVSRLSFHS